MTDPRREATTGSDEAGVARGAPDEPAPDTGGNEGPPPDPVAGPYQPILELARPYLDTRGNEEHTEESVAFAWRLLEAEGGDPEVVIPGVILHDVGWSSVPEDGQTLAFGPAPTRPDLLRRHEQEGARIAREILGSVGHDPVLIEEIARIVGRHDSSHDAASRNEALVKDSDKLYRLTRPGYIFFLELFELDYREYLGIMAARADRWFFTDTAKRWADDMFADLEAYAGELEGAHGSADPTPGTRSDDAHHDSAASGQEGDT